MTLSAGLFVYLWKEIGDRGIYADETGTSGALTAYEYALAFVMVTFAAISILLFLRKKKLDPAIKKKFQYYVLLIIVLLFMICTLVSFLTS